MPKIRMLFNRSPRYKKGEVYEVDDAEAKFRLSMAECELVQDAPETAMAEPPAEKAVKPKGKARGAGSS